MAKRIERPDKSELEYFLYEQLKTKQEIADYYDVSKPLVKQWADEYGLEFLGNTNERWKLECRKVVKEVRMWIEYHYDRSFDTYEPSEEDYEFYNELTTSHMNNDLTSILK